MIRPVTSTSVATNGADEVAGSNPNRRKKNGSIEPVKVPQSTTPINERLTVSPTRNQCGPYMLETAFQAAIRTKPIAPRMHSKQDAREQLAAHHPPPVLEPDFAQGEGADDQCGRLRARVAAAGDDQRDEQGEDDGFGLISFSKKPIAVAVSISPTNRMTSQLARLRIIAGKRRAHVGIVESFQAAESAEGRGSPLARRRPARRPE